MQFRNGHGRLVLGGCQLVLLLVFGSFNSGTLPREACEEDQITVWSKRPRSRKQILSDPSPISRL